MIQSVGMTSACFTIIYAQILIERTAVIFGSIGGVVGIVLGLQFIAPQMPPPYAKMCFVSIWFAFAVNLFILNRQKQRHTFMVIQRPNLGTYLVLLIVGFVGGVLSAIAGSGIDICTFSVLTLLYHVSEKTATPTSVVLMGINTVIGFFYQGVIRRGIAADTWAYWAACIPIVVVGAPGGAFVSSFLHRQVLAWFVYIADTSQFIFALIVIKFTLALKIATIAMLLFGLLFFTAMALVGHRKLHHYEEYEFLTRKGQSPIIT